MNFAKTPRGELPTLPITPMVDVIFTLLAFFLLATQLVVAERDFGMGYRPTPSGRQVLGEDLPQTVPVYVRRQGSGVSLAVGQAHLHDNDLDALRAKLMEINLPDVEVTVYADEDLTVGQAAGVLDAVLASPMKKVSMAPLDKAEAPRPQDAEAVSR